MRNIKSKISFALSLALLMTQTAISIPVNAANDTPVVIVKEDWSDYAIGAALGTKTTINGGFGFSSGKYGADSATVVESIPGAKATERAIGFSNKALTARPLAYKLSTTEDNEFYIKWTANSQLTVDNNCLVGMAFDNYKVGVGMGRYNATTNRLTTYHSPTGSRSFTYDVVDAETGTNAAKLNKPRVYIAKFTIDADGTDSISLKTYDAVNDDSLAGENGLIYPTEWDMTTEYDLSKYVFDDLTIWGRSNMAHIGGIYIYKKASQMSETEINNHMKLLMERIPAKESLNVQNINDYMSKIEDVNKAAEGLNIDALDYDIDGRWAKCTELLASLPKLEKIEMSADFEKAVAKITFNREVVGDAITMEKDGTPFTAFTKTSEVLESKTVVTLTFENDYEYDADYDIIFGEGIKSAEDDTLELTPQIKTVQIPRFFDSTLEVSNTADGLKVNVLVKNYTHPEDVLAAVTVGLFTADEEMLASQSAQAVLSANGKIEFKDLKLSDTKVPAGCSVRVFCMDSFQGMETIFKTVTKTIK